MANLAETCAVLEELTAVFNSDDDPALLTHVLETVSQAESSWQAKQVQVQTIISDLTAAVQALQEEIASCPQQQYTEELLRTEVEESRLKAEISNLQNKKQAATEKLTQIKKEDEELQRSRTEELNTVNSQLPHIKHMINLYSCISNITWDFDVPETEIKGTVFLPKVQHAKPFHFKDIAAEGVPKTANALWDLMWLNHTSHEKDQVASELS